MIANEAYLSAITDKHFSEFYLQDGGKNQLRYNNNNHLTASFPGQSG